MFRVFACLTAEHDWRLVMLAGLVCFAASIVEGCIETQGYHFSRPMPASSFAKMLRTAKAAVRAA